MRFFQLSLGNLRIKWFRDCDFEFEVKISTPIKWVKNPPSDCIRVEQVISVEQKLNSIHGSFFCAVIIRLISH